VKRGALIAAATMALAGLAALWFACGGRHESARPPAPPTRELQTAAPESSPASAPSASGTSGKPAPSHSAPSSAPAVAAPGSSTGPLLNANAGSAGQPGALWQKIETASRQDLQLLASLERELGSVPPEADELIRRRTAGATPAELREWLQKHGPKELRARLILSRWLSQLQDAGAPVPAPARSGSGKVPKLLGRLNKKDAGS